MNEYNLSLFSKIKQHPCVLGTKLKDTVSQGRSRRPTAKVPVLLKQVQFSVESVLHVAVALGVSIVPCFSVLARSPAHLYHNGVLYDKAVRRGQFYHKGVILSGTHSRNGGVAEWSIAPDL